MNDVMERTATSYAVIDAVDNKASDCRGMLKSLVDATNGITGPQAGLLGCLVVSIAGWRDMEYTPFATWLNPTPRRAHLWKGALCGEYGSARRGEQPLIGGQENRCR